MIYLIKLYIYIIYIVIYSYKHLNKDMIQKSKTMTKIKTTIQKYKNLWF